MFDEALLIVGEKTYPKIADVLSLIGTKVRKRLFTQVQEPLDLFEAMPMIYFQASICCPNLDVRVLLDGYKNRKFEHVFCEEDAQSSEEIKKKTPYNMVCLGGTFDMLHNGHKVLLSTAILKANEEIVCGVTTGEMNKKKTLWELIKSVESRINDVIEFIQSVSHIKYRIEPITDPFGPSIVWPEIDCIVVSEETIKGGEAINIKRKERNLKILDIFVIKLLEGSDEILKEVKISSSTRRRESLGSLRKEVEEKEEKKRPPYVVGLTGGIASGKKQICQILKEQRCEIISFDQDTQQKLAKSTSDIVVVKGNASNSAELVPLVDQLWATFVPREEAIRRIVDRDDCISIDKVGILSDYEEAQEMLNLEVDNSERISKAHVVFCTLWGQEETEKQVMKALKMLREKYLL